MPVVVFDPSPVNDLEHGVSISCATTLRDGMDGSMV